MVDIKVKRGLDIPIKGSPTSAEVQSLMSPQEVALNLIPFEHCRFKLLVKVGDVVKIGQPLARDKGCDSRVFVSPGGGVIKEVRRGLKRRLLNIVIELADHEDVDRADPLDIEGASRQEVVDHLAAGGLFTHIRRRPFNILANPAETPRSIFVKAIESAPFAPSPEIQVQGYEEDFRQGLKALAKLTTGSVHLVCRKGCAAQIFTGAEGVQKHTVQGPYPAASPSLHIHCIDPIKSAEDVVWTVNVNDVIAIGRRVGQGTYFTERVIGIGGPGILEDKRGYFKARVGHPVGALIAGRNTKGLLRLVSGDVLMGDRVEVEDFLHFQHNVFSVVSESVDREFMHFFRLGSEKYTATRTYLSGLVKTGDRQYDFTTSQHGEPRAFVDGTVYQKFMPINVPVMALIKAIMAEDFDLAEQLGLLEVDAEDFAIPTFVCPSKIEMTELIKEALHAYALETVH